MGDNIGFLILWSPFILFLSVIFVWAHYDNKTLEKKRKERKIVSEGVYESVEYGEYGYEVRRHVGMAGHTTDHHIMKVTIIRFNDGRTAALKGNHDMPFPKGTPIRIIENGLGERRIEKAD